VVFQQSLSEVLEILDLAMEQIAPYSLWIGHAGDGRAFRELFDRGIQVVMQLALEEAPIALPRELVYCRFPLVDGGGNDPEILATAVETLARMLQSELKTLVCCGAGMSRSPLLAAAAISIVEKRPLQETLIRVTTGRPADVATSLIADVANVVRNCQEKK